MRLDIDDSLTDVNEPIAIEDVRVGDRFHRRGFYEDFHGVKRGTWSGWFEVVEIDGDSVTIVNHEGGAYPDGAEVTYSIDFARRFVFGGKMAPLRFEEDER